MHGRLCGLCDGVGEACEAGMRRPRGAEQRLDYSVYVPEDGEVTTDDIDKYVFGVRAYEDRFE